MRRYRPLLLLIAAGLVTESDGVAQQIRPAAGLLTLEAARDRAARIGAVAYQLALRIDEESPEYSGTVRIEFELAAADGDLTLDFVDGVVDSVEVNGDAVDGRYNGYFLTLPGDSLVAGTNVAAVRFSHRYSSDGSGLYRFIDPEDGRAYLFTDFEPFHQNRLFPSFDQPDLKASYTTQVTAPTGWVVVSVTAESGVEQAGDEQIWTFPASPPISTYIYALHAGEYRVWESDAGGIPLRLFARESLARYVNPDDWFGFTRQGFEFFQRYFGIQYPFGKYDQLIVPHFNWGAMENVGAVTFNERYVQRGAVTRQDRRALASVLLHEMAHMWFGNLVTMDWWSGLWLNESFATFMATLAMAEATEFSEAWQDAYTDSIDAYRADERETTHAIDQPVPDTDSAFSNFDAITYEKGSATLKQLNHLVGPDVFRLGVSQYLQAHAYGNTTIGDFLDAISTASGRDLGEWSRQWLLEPGTNSIAVEVHCDAGMLAGLTVTQDAPPEWPTLRTHRTQLGLYRFDGDAVSIRTLPVTYSGEATEVVAPADPGRCPDLVYPNHGDWDFVRARLEPDVLPVLGRHLGRFTDPLARAMLWQGVWEMVLDTRLALTDYVEFVLGNLASEPDDGVMRQVLGSLEESVAYLRKLDPEVTRLAVLGPRIEGFLWEQMFASPAGSDRRVFLFDQYAEVVGTDSGVGRLAQALAGDDDVLPDGMELDQERRWNALQALSALDHPAAGRLLAGERERDATDQGRLAAMTAEVGRPDPGSKAGWVDTLLGAEDINLADARAVAAGLFPDHQRSLYEPLADRILAALGTLDRTRDASYFRPIMRGLVKPWCSQEYLRQLDGAIAAADELHPTLQRGLRDTRFDVRRCLAIGERLAADK